MLLRGIIRKNVWSFLSLLISVGDAVLILCTVWYLDSHGQWETSPPPRGQAILGQWGACSVVLSFAASVCAITWDRSKILAVAVMSVSLLSFFLYLQ